MGVLELFILLELFELFELFEWLDETEESFIPEEGAAAPLG
jgi:hypothetical protein